MSAGGRQERRRLRHQQEHGAVHRGQRQAAPHHDTATLYLLHRLAVEAALHSAVRGLYLCARRASAAAYMSSRPRLCATTSAATAAPRAAASHIYTHRAPRHYTSLHAPSRPAPRWQCTNLARQQRRQAPGPRAAHSGAGARRHHPPPAATQLQTPASLR